MFDINKSVIYYKSIFLWILWNVRKKGGVNGLILNLINNNKD